jgi:glucosamine-6-phosphate deaminase
MQPISFTVDLLNVRIYQSQPEMAKHAADLAFVYLKNILSEKGRARVILASAASQVQFLAEFTKQPLEWNKITFFHMDEYLGISKNHSASFRKFLIDHVINRIGSSTFHLIEGDALEPISECERYAKLLKQEPIDLCCLGIGENGHIAFNDPPVANFNDPYPVKIVKLDEACRRQQVGEGAFPDINSVPAYAITLTIPTLCSAKKMICICPEFRKANAVFNTLNGEITPKTPASILRRHPDATLFLDSDSAKLLDLSKLRK